MRKIVHLVIALMVVSLVAGAVDTSVVAQGRYCASDAEMEMLHLINDYRRDHGLAPLTLTARLGTGAQIKASDMANRNYLEHTSPDGEKFWDLLARVGYTYSTAMAENIAAGYGDATATFNQWKNSPPHRTTMLSSRYTAIGIGSGYSDSSTYGWYWATEFGGVVGTPAGACNGDDGGNDDMQATIDQLVAVLIEILRDVLGHAPGRLVLA